MAEVFMPAEHKAPLANPDFSFPVRSDRSMNLPPLQDPSKSASGPLPRFPSHQRPGNLSFSTLPPFDFASSDRRHSPSPPPRSPSRLAPPGSHATGHKRGASEYVGGDASLGGPVLVSTGAGTPDEQSPIATSPVKPPFVHGRRGHAHRRSAAVSQGEVKRIMQPAADQKAGSAPSTPLEATFNLSRPEVNRTHSQPDMKSSSPAVPDVPMPTSTGVAATIPPASRPTRVGFSEALEFIPRPLSTISSETSSSMSTIKANHSISDSISSIVSGGSPRNARAMSPQEVSGARESPLARPQTPRSQRDPEPSKMGEASRPAGLEPSDSYSTSDDVFSFDPPQTLSSLSTMSPHLSPKTSGPCLRKDTPPMALSDLLRPASQDVVPQRPETPPRPRSRRQHMKKSWAGMILHRKERPVDGPDPSKPLPSHCPPTESDFSLDDVTFDDDTTYIIEQPASHASASPVLQTNISPRRASGRVSTFDEELPGTIIDLDAALGTAGRPGRSLGYASGKRRMHSSGETGGFSGIGMHYHRRTESAPVIEGFDRNRLGVSRLGSNPAMSDAIAEEEEDGDANARERDAAQCSGLGVNIVESDTSDEPQRRQRSANLSAAGPRKQALSVDNLPLIVAPSDQIDVVDAEDEPRFSVLTKSSDESSITPTISPDPLGPRPATAPIETASLQTPTLTYGTTPESISVVSSAEYSKTSFDVQDHLRIHTASSSITDRTTLNSSKIGDISAASIDDVPSLTSSASTMFSSQPARFSSSAHRASSTERSTSLTDQFVGHRSGRPGSSGKRSSLVSLTRLMGGPYNRSKLHLEETITQEPAEKSEKKKRKRISRMMTFWKSKEKLPRF